MQTKPLSVSWPVVAGRHVPRSADHAGHAAAVRAGQEAAEGLRGGDPIPQPHLQPVGGLVSQRAQSSLALPIRTGLAAFCNPLNCLQRALHKHCQDHRICQVPAGGALPAETER